MMSPIEGTLFDLYDGVIINYSYGNSETTLRHLGLK